MKTFRIHFKTCREYEELHLWATVFYPKLLLFLYDYEGSSTQSLPHSVDRKLKWICPVPCVRVYLHKQCGVNPKWEWLYKIFWRGKKHFMLWHLED